MDKKIFFNQDGVTVSKTRLIVHGQLYEINKISSLSYKKSPPDLGASILCFLIGVLLMVDEGELFAFGGCLILLGVIAGVAASPKHIVILNMPDGAKEALVSTDKPHVERVMQALNASMGSAKRAETLEAAKDTDSDLPTFTPPAMQ